MLSIGLVAEGPTDTAVINNILHGFLRGTEYDLSALPRTEDWQDTRGNRLPTNWTSVLRYLSEENFRNAFQFLDFLIVQIDTDVCAEPGFDVPRKDAAGADLSPQQLVSAVRGRLVQAIGLEFYADNKDRIIFGIAVDATECWLLPLLYTDNRKTRTSECLSAANQQLKKQGFTLAVDGKAHQYYDRASEGYRKNRELMAKGPANPSLEIFLAELEALSATGGSG